MKPHNVIFQWQKGHTSEMTLNAQGNNSVDAMASRGILQAAYEQRPVCYY